MKRYAKKNEGALGYDTPSETKMFFEDKVIPAIKNVEGTLWFLQVDMNAVLLEGTSFEKMRKAMPRLGVIEGECEDYMNVFDPHGIRNTKMGFKRESGGASGYVYKVSFECWTNAQVGTSLWDVPFHIPRLTVNQGVIFEAAESPIARVELYIPRVERPYAEQGAVIPHVTSGKKDLKLAWRNE